MKIDTIFLSKEMALSDYLCRNTVAGDLFMSFTVDDVWVHCNRLSLISDYPVSNDFFKSHLKYFISNSNLLDLYLEGNSEYPYLGDTEIRAKFTYKLKRDKVTDILGYDYNGTHEANKAFREYLIKRFNLKEEYDKFPIAVLRSLFMFHRESDYTPEYFR